MAEVSVVISKLSPSHAYNCTIAEEGGGVKRENQRLSDPSKAPARDGLARSRTLMPASPVGPLRRRDPGGDLAQAVIAQGPEPVLNREAAEVPGVGPLANVNPPAGDSCPHPIL
jgi:hypothetical protein